MWIRGCCVLMLVSLGRTVSFGVLDSSVAAVALLQYRFGQDFCIGPRSLIWFYKTLFELALSRNYIKCQISFYHDLDVWHKNGSMWTS
jgi:hypothetical protein